MGENTLKSQATKGMLWNTIEKLSVQAGQFGISVVLARLLLPSDFGLIGMLTVFIAISQSFVDSGMGLALVQKKDRSEVDFSTVFVFNFLVSLGIYGILYFCAPFIASFYEMPQLVILTRVLMLNIVINSLGVVQTSRLTINLDFKTMAKVNLVSVIVSGIVAVLMAYANQGVWALVFQNLVRTVVLVVMLWYLSRWRPSVKFSKDSFKQLFGFGSKILGVGLIGTIFTNVYNVVIGKYYSVKDLGYYTQGYQFATLTSGTITSILQKVTFPILASLQDNQERLVEVYRKLLGMTAFIIFPLMTLFALLAEPFIRFFLTDKWLPTVPLLQLLCFSRILNPISTLNMNILNAKGRSDLYFLVDVSKLPMIIIALIITIPMGIKAMIIGSIITSFIAFFINAYMPGKLFSYGAIEQIKDMSPKVLATIGMSILVFLVTYYVDVPFLKLTIGTGTGILGYYLFSCILKIEEIKEVDKILKKIKILK